MGVEHNPRQSNGTRPITAHVGLCRCPTCEILSSCTHVCTIGGCTAAYRCQQKFTTAHLEKVRNFTIHERVRNFTIHDSCYDCTSVKRILCALSFVYLTVYRRYSDVDTR